jgi:CBS domain-containing protein
LMLTVVIATLSSRFMLQGESIYTLKLTRRGIRLQRGRDVDIMQGLTVAEAMRTPAPTIHTSASLSELRGTLRSYQTRSLVVLNGHDHMCGMVTLSDLQKTYESLTKAEVSTIKKMTVGDICKREVVSVRPEDVLWRAVRTMGARGIGGLPVVSGGHVMGMISRQDIMKAYNIAIERKVRDQHIAERIRLNALTGAHVIQLQVGSHSALIGQCIRDMSWPDKSLVASIQRGSKLIVPHGNTQIKVNDLLTVVAEPEVESILREMCVSTITTVPESEKPLSPIIEEEVEELEDMLAAEYDEDAIAAEHDDDLSEEPLLPEIEEEIEELEDMLAAEYDEDAIAAENDNGLSEEPLLPEIEEEIEELEDMLAAEYDDEDDPAPDEIDEAVD